MQRIIVELHHFPSTYWFALFLYADQVIIDDRELFRKQTYRHRAVIAGANKLLNLVVPVKKGKSQKHIRDVQIERPPALQRTQWQTIQSAYRSAPYFEYYQDRIQPFFKSNTQYLFELNQEIFQTCLELLGWEEMKPEFTSESKNIEQAEDFRGLIRPKKQSTVQLPFKNIQYPQVFQDRLGFHPGLSILDLLFNCGPDATRILMEIAGKKAIND